MLQISGFPLTIKCVCQLAFQYTHVNNIEGFNNNNNNQAGHKLLKGFLKYYPQIILQTAKNLSIAHAMGANPTIISNWFSLLEEIKTKFRILSLAKSGQGMKQAYKTFLKKLRF